MLPYGKKNETEMAWSIGRGFGGERAGGVQGKFWQTLLLYVMGVKRVFTFDNILSHASVCFSIYFTVRIL